VDERVLILLRGRLGVGGNLLHGLSLVPRKRCPFADPAPFGGGQGLTPDGGKGLRAGQHPGTKAIQRGDAEAVPAMRAGEALAGALDTGMLNRQVKRPIFDR